MIHPSRPRNFGSDDPWLWTNDVVYQQSSLRELVDIGTVVKTELSGTEGIETKMPPWARVYSTRSEAEGSSCVAWYIMNEYAPAIGVVHVLIFLRLLRTVPVAAPHGSRLPASLVLVVDDEPP